MASPPFGSQPPADSPSIISHPLPLISPPPSPSPPTPVVGSPSQRPFSPVAPSVSPLPPQTPAPSVTLLTPASSPLPPVTSSPPLPPLTPASSPPEPPQPPVSSEPPSLEASPPPRLANTPSPPATISPVVSPLRPQPSPPSPPSIPSLPLPQSPPPQLPPSLPVPPPTPRSTPSRPVIISPVVSPVRPQPKIPLPPSPPSIPSLPLPRSPLPQLPPLSPVSPSPPTRAPSKPSPPLSAVTPSSLVEPAAPQTSHPPPKNSSDPHAFAEQNPRPSSAGGAPPVVALPLVTANLPRSIKQQHQVPVGLILGCVVGGVFLFLLLALLLGFVYKWSRRRNRQREDHFAEKPPALAPSGIHLGDLAVGDQQCQQVTSLAHGGHIINFETQGSTIPFGSDTVSGSRSGDLGCGVNRSPPDLHSSHLRGSGGCFTYEELAAATNCFSEGNLVGEGGFGYVHRGVLSSGKEVAVKQLREGRKQGEKEFQAEVEIISRIHHKHLVSLLGYCINGAKRLLVYEFVSNNTLEFHLHGNEDEVMSWETRLRIAIGSAKGLAYLHEDCDPKILHRDIKAANILVDNNFEAKVSDFGLARSYSDASVTHVSTQVVGTFGYLAPEYASSGKVTEKSDVYSYGVVLLELITGRPPICFSESVSRTSLVEWARPLLTGAVERRNFEGLVDPRLQNKYDNGEMTQMVACAAACVRHSAWLRPRMSQVVNALEGGTFAFLNMDNRNKPGHSTIFSCSPSSKGSSYDYKQYKEEMLKFNVALARDESEILRSESGLKPSVSNTDMAASLSI